MTSQLTEIQRKRGNSVQLFLISVAIAVFLVISAIYIFCGSPYLTSLPVVSDSSNLSLSITSDARGITSRNSEDINFSWTITNQMIESFVARLPPFMPGYRNPCWEEQLFSWDQLYDSNFYMWHRRHRVSPYLMSMRKQYGLRYKQGLRSRVRCLPYFYIIGFSKSGTTDLFNKLRYHPLIAQNIPLKEAMFWNRRRLGRLANSDIILEKTASFGDYVDLYDLAGKRISLEVNYDDPERLYHDAVIADGTPSYIWDYDGWRNTSGNQGLSEPRYIVGDYIKHFTPKAKFVVIMRNPIARQYSDYLFVNHGGESNQKFHLAALESIAQINACLNERTERECFYDPDLNLNMPLRMRLSHYYIFIKDWISVFPRNQFIFARLEDYSANKSEIINEITNFLGLGDLPPRKVSMIMQARSKSNKKSKKDMAVGEILPETQHLLDRYFKPWNQRLADLLSDEKYLWSK